MIVWEIFGVNLMHPEVWVEGFLAALYSPPFQWKRYEVTVVCDSYLVSLSLRGYTSVWYSREIKLSLLYLMHISPFSRVYFGTEFG